MPALLEDMDTMSSCPDANRQRECRRQLVQECWRHESSLSRWRADVGIADPTYQLDVDAPSPSVDLLAAAHILCLYWSICIILYSTLRIASEAEAELPARADPRFYCRRIAETIPILLHPLSGIYGVHLANFPVALALTYLHAVDGSLVTAEKRLFLDAMRRSGHGETVDRFVTSTQHGIRKSSRPVMGEAPETIEAEAVSWLGG